MICPVHARLAATILLVLAAPTAFAQNSATVAILSTGGTIASRHDPAKSGYVPALTADDLVAAVPAIRKVAQIALTRTRQPEVLQKFFDH
ncbi:MAG: asparaginase domain-containing protein [Gaiellales bacterium]